MIDFDHAEPIYGINEHEPFFSAGHLFLTREGWKAMEPTVVREENPARKIAGELAVGDVVFRVVSFEPFAYEEVEVERISSRRLVAGDQLYGLYLHGARSYHVHGFCVAMN